MAKRRLPSNWRDRLEIVLDADNNENTGAGATLQFIKGRTPRGFYRRIGNIYVEDSCLAEIEIEKPFKRKGLGRDLLLFAVTHLATGKLMIWWLSASGEGRAFYKWFAENVANSYEADFFGGMLTIYCNKDRTDFRVKCP